MTTQAQVDALRSWYANGLSVVNAITADPMPPTPSPAVENFTQYSSAYLGNKSYYTCSVDPNGRPTSSPAFAYLVDQSTPTSGRIVWGTGAEYRSVLTLASTGEQWCVVSAYGSTDTGAVYPVETVRADWTNMASPNGIRDITGIFQPGQKGSPEMPYALPSSGTWRLREWFYLCSSAGGIETRDRPAYAEQLIEFGLMIANPAWQGSGSQLRRAIRFQEAWWDPLAGWVRATCPTLPWTNVPTAYPWIPTPNTMQPQTVNVTYGGTQAFGLGAGIMWQYQYSDYRAAVANAM